MEHLGTVSGTIIQSDTGEFFSSLSVSGTPVNIGPASVAGVAVESLNALQGDVLVTGTGRATTVTAGDTITIDVPVSVSDLNAQTGSVTITGVGTTTSTTVGGAITISGSLRVRESDSSPLVDQVTEIVVTTGTLTNLGGGVVQIDTGGSAGGGGADVDQLQNTLYGQAFVA